MTRADVRTVSDLERELSEARARLSDGERTLQMARARLQDFVTRYQDTVGERFELLKRLQSRGDGEPPTAPERTPTIRAPRAGRPPGHTEFERLYRELARRVHPDLASDSAERAVRTRVMAELNIARDTFDFERARRIGDDWGADPEDLEADPGVSRFERLLLAIERVEARLTAVTADAVRLRESNLYRLFEVVTAQQRAGIDVLGETAADLDAQIREARVRIALPHAQSSAMTPGEIPAQHAEPREPAAAPGRGVRMAPLGFGVVLAAAIAVGAAFYAATPSSPNIIVTNPAVRATPAILGAQGTAVPVSYQAIERQQSTSGRTTAVVRIVVDGSPSPAEKISTLAEAARREIRSQQAVVIYAYRSPGEIGGPYTVGRAYLSVDGKGWTGDGRTEDGPDLGGVVGSIVVTLGALPETQIFNAQR